MPQIISMNRLLEAVRQRKKNEMIIKKEIKLEGELL